MQEACHGELSEFCPQKTGAATALQIADYSNIKGLLEQVGFKQPSKSWKGFPQEGHHKALSLCPAHCVSLMLAADHRTPNLRFKVG